MKTAFPHRPQNLAVALVIVLALVVLLSGVVVAYFSQAMASRKLSDSSLQQAKADELARSALEIIAADLKQEIVNGSTATTFGDTTLYIPKTSAPPALPNAGMLPVRNQELSGASPAPIPNLIRISGATPVASPGSEHPASNAPSTVASGNRRSIPRARWNGHYLMPLKNSASSTLDSTPVDSFTPPNWVFVTAEKGPVVLKSPSLDANNEKVTAIGRYAYAIFDESGLLDANVAGYPGVLPAADTHPVDSARKYGYSPKGNLAFADLTQLFPTTSTLSASQKQLLVDNIVGWRNFASAKADGSFNTFTFENNGAAYSDSLLANRNGFLRIAGTATLPQTRTDQAFLGRQQMLDFVLHGLATPANTADLQNIVQYLGTFSRAVTSPMWSPAKDAPVPAYAYKTNADAPTWSDPRGANNGQNPNRNIPNVRFAAPTIIAHYNDDGSQTSYAVNAGDSLVRHRFSLAKLAWLKTGTNGPDYSAFKAGLSKAEMDAAIASCFGLEWQPNTIGSSAGWSNAGWKYVAATPTAVHIKTLGEIATESREPNFFELLKAGILDGSLGRDPGVLNTQVADGSGTPGNLCNLLEVYEADPNIQILQIGANIIDQADADSYPTSIYLRIFDLAGKPACDELTVNTVYGTENLPCLSRLGAIAIADPAVVYTSPPFTIVTRGTLKFWLQPELWNPHQVPAATSTERPTDFRAYAYGSAYGGWRTNSGAVSKGTPVFYDDGSGSGAITSGSIYFSDPGGINSPFYNNPKLLTLDGTNIDQFKTASENLYEPTKWSALGGDTDHYTTKPKPPNQFAAFSVGSFANFGPSASAITKMILSNPNLTISLQYLGPDNLYHPYNFMTRLGPVHYTRAMTSNGSRINGGTRWFNVSGDDGLRAACRPDPRTDRFGLSRVWVRDWPQNETMSPGEAGRRIGNNLEAVPAQAAFTFLKGPSDPYFTRNIGLWAINDSNYPFVKDRYSSSKAYYADQDGVVRVGDSYRQNDPDIDPSYGTRGPRTGDGCVYYHGNVAVSPASTLTDPKAGSAQARRPAILNRPFRSVGELGFAYRDQPFKSLDFWSSGSGDLGLLDLFTPSDQPYVVAGQINLNTAQAPVLQAILAGAAKNDTDLTVNISAADAKKLQISADDAKTLANLIATELSGANGPVANRTELAARLETPIQTALNVKVSANANWANKANAEAPVRALTDVSNTRTWNIMIDLVAQTGTFAPQAPETVAALNSSFQVLGERRYWMHLAIDRLTGRVVDQQLELVYE